MIGRIYQLQTYKPIPLALPPICPVCGRPTTGTGDLCELVKP